MQQRRTDTGSFTKSSTKYSTEAATGASIRNSLVRTGWICITIPVLIQFGLFITEFQLTKDAEKLAQQESYESEANDLTMRAITLVSKGWAALILRGARSVAKDDQTIDRNIAEARKLIEDLKKTPRFGSDSAEESVVAQLQSQVNNLERTNSMVSLESTQDSIGERGTIAMFDRIRTLKRSGVSGLHMLDEMSDAASQHRQELTAARLKTSEKRAQVQMFINIALFIDMLAAISVPLLFLTGISRRLKFLIENARRLPTGDVLDRNLKGTDEISFLNSALCDAQMAIQETEARRQLLVEMISHDVRAPLSSATLMLHEMESVSGSSGPSGASSEERLGRLQRTFKRINVLVSDMLDMDKLEGGNIQLDLQIVDIAGVIESSVEALLPQANSRSITIDQRVAAREMVIDPARIGQVLDNLLSNAIKHSPAGSVISVTTSVRAGEVHIAIADQGAGIAPRDLDNIFERKFQTTEGRAKGGYGLGLFICKQLVTLHKGKIKVVNLRPAGCKFTIILPDDDDEFEDTGS